MAAADTPPSREAIERFKRQIEGEWQNPELSAAYRKWDHEEAEWGRAARSLIVERARLEPGMEVLDLASGHGEPALTIADVVGPEGRVIATDLGPGLIELAREKARRAGLENIGFKVADAHDLPFEDGTFDAVTCRFGVAFFADYPQALREARRVLKPEGARPTSSGGASTNPRFER